jgi:hypothetical protein
MIDLIDTYFIPYCITSFAIIFAVGCIQTLLVKRGVARIINLGDEYSEDYSVINGFFGIDFTPSAIFTASIFGPIILPLLIIRGLIMGLGSIMEWANSPSKNQNSLVEEAAKEGLDLNEFVLKKDKQKTKNEKHQSNHP